MANKRRGRVAKIKSKKTGQRSFKQVLLRLEPYCVNNLDALCHANGRSRPDLLSIMIDREYAALQKAPTRRINP